MRRVLALALLCLPWPAWGGTVTLRVTADSGLKGTATATNRLLDDGTKESHMTMTLRDAAGSTVKIVQESSYASDARPIFKRQSTWIGDGEQQTVVATFNKGSVSIDVAAQGRTDHSEVALPLDTTICEKFEFWFLRDAIPVKGVNAFYRFDLVSRTFEKTKAVFEGARTIRVNGKTVRANLVVVDDTSFYLDEKGDPYKIVSPGVVMERI